MDYTQEIKLASKEGGNKGARNPILCNISGFHSTAHNNSFWWLLSLLLEPEEIQG